MKALKTLVAIALSAGGLGSAVTLGVVANNENIQRAQAATTSVTLAGSFNGWSTTAEPLTKNGNYWTITRSLSANDTFKFVVNGGTWVGWGNGVSVPSGKISSESGNGSNFKCLTSGSYILKAIDGIDGYGDKSYGIVIEENAVTTYTVTKHAVLDGVLESGDIGTDVVPETDTYAVPSAIHRAGYHFGGWFTNQACTTAYTAGTLSGNLDLYAKYTSLVDDTYVYYVTGSTSATTNYVYTFGGDDQFGDWPGTKITDVVGVQEVHGVMSFQGTSQNIYKIPYATAASDTGIIIHTNGGSQTVNMSLVSHSAYWFITDSSLENYHNDDAGTALDLILATEAKRNAVTASGNIAAYSVCGISASDAASLYNTYYGLSADIKSTYVDNSTTYTYDGLDTANQTNVSFADIMAELKVLALRGNQTVLGSSRPTLVAQNHTNVIVVTIVAILTVSGTGTFFLLRKKKEQ